MLQSEFLHIERSSLLVDPKVLGSSLRLKHLHISKGAYVLSVEISAPNLIHGFPTCTNLRHLSWKVPIHHGRRLFTLRPLIEASPFLHEFALEIFKNFDPNRLLDIQLRAVAINGGSLRSTSTGKQRACGSNDANVNVRMVMFEALVTCNSMLMQYCLLTLLQSPPIIMP
ncbi:hypothetical protein V6N13_009573 [Hibiscus sabdariffa]